MATSNFIARARLRTGDVTLLIGTPQACHAEELSFTMRRADRLELDRFAGGRGVGIVGLLKEAIEISTISRVALINDQVAAIWGVHVPSMLGGVGFPWCFTSNVIDRHKRLLLKLSPFYVREMQKICPDGLQVFVDLEHVQAIRWLKWLGFTVADENTLICGYPFRSASLEVG